ncbi:MAG: hypothetical protein KGQ61_10350 [Planctomycetes bacterium]|nr:hypothetical protein [Planctomycetota bacterium]
MTQELLDPVELRQRGFEALVDALGWVNAVRFVQQYETSRLDYTSQRDTLLPSWSGEDLARRLEPAGRDHASGHDGPRNPSIPPARGTRSG